MCVMSERLAAGFHLHHPDDNKETGELADEVCKSQVGKGYGRYEKRGSYRRV